MYLFEKTSHNLGLKIHTYVYNYMYIPDFLFFVDFMRLKLLGRVGYFHSKDILKINLKIPIN